MPHSIAIRLAALVLALAVAPSVWAPPKPSAVPLRWELRFEPGDLRLYVDPVTERAYWYFTYVITNMTGRDQVWAPTFVLFTDGGEILYSGKSVPGRIQERLREMLRNPLLETQNESIGDLLQGVENARDGLVIWPADRLDVNELSLFVSGISGETVRVEDPITGDPVLLRKTLQRDYLIRGSALARGSLPVEYERQEWVMR